MSDHQYHCAARPCRHAPDTAIPPNEEVWSLGPLAPRTAGPGEPRETRHKECVRTPHWAELDEMIDRGEI
jgi:hypothetical protein